MSQLALEVGVTRVFLDALSLLVRHVPTGPVHAGVVAFGDGPFFRQPASVPVSFPVEKHVSVHVIVIATAVHSTSNRTRRGAHETRRPAHHTSTAAANTSLSRTPGRRRSTRLAL